MLVILVVLFRPVAEAAFDVAHPRVIQHLGDAYAVLGFENQHARDEVLDFVAYALHREFKLTLQYYFVEVANITGFEGNCSLNHSIQEHTQTPHISEESLVPLVEYDLGGEVRRCPALFVDDLAFFDQPADAEVAEFYAAVAVHQHVVEFDVAVEDGAAVAVPQGVEDLFEYGLG